MQLKALKVKNFKKIKEVSIKVKDENVIIIAGLNGQGKTSTLDALWALLDWKKATHEIPRPIREGQNSANVFADLGDMKVEREWKKTEKKGTTTKLTVSSKKPGLSPQALLDSFIGKLSFDPLVFARMNPKEQLFEFLNVLDLDIDLEQLDKDRASFYEDRTLKGRERDKSKAQFEAMETVDNDVEVKRINTAAISKELEEAYNLNNNIDNITNEVQRIDAQVLEFEKKIAVLKTQSEKQGKWLKENKKVDTEKLQSEIENANEINNQADEYDRYFKLEKEYKYLDKEYEDYTSKIAKIDFTKTEAVRKADMPIEGLGVNYETLLFNDIPFIQLADSEKLKVSLAIAMKLNPGLKVIRITDGSLLDSENEKVIEKMAKKFGYLVLMEKVGEDIDTKFIIREGEIKDGKSTKK